MTDLIEFLRAQVDMEEHFATVVRLAAKHRARMLREVDAKRQRLDILEAMLRDDAADETAQQLLRLEVLPYADHPDYREEWRP